MVSDPYFKIGRARELFRKDASVDFLFDPIFKQRHITASFLNQCLVGKSAFCYAIDKTIKPFGRVPLDISIVQPECELINVAARVLGRDVVEGSVDPALQNGPHALDSVDAYVTVDVQLHVFASTVIDGLV